VSLREEYIIEDGERAADYIREGENRLYSFNIPDDKEITSITTELYIGTINSSNVRMFVAPAKDKDTTPSSSNTIRVFYSWLGLTAIAHEGTKDFCKKCAYKVLISSKIDTGFVLTYRTNKGVTEILDTGIDLYDSIGMDGKKCYEYNIKNETDNILSIYVKYYSGFGTLQVNPLRLPSKDKDFAFIAGEFNDVILSITSEDRKRVKATKGKYYLCVSSIYYASYNLMVLLQDPKENKKFPIHSGIARTMIVKKGELVLFEYFLKDKHKLDIDFFLISSTGNADLYVKYCIYTINTYGDITNNCELDINRFDKDDIMKSTSSESVDYITTNFDPSMCKGKNVKCSYLIGVLGVVDSRFSLSVFTTDDVEVPLIEGVPIFGTVDNWEFSKFSFIIKDPQATAVKIQLTSLSGDADLSVKRERDGLYKGSFKSSSAVDSVEFTKEKDKELESVYHVEVFGHTVATFTLVYHVTSPQRAESHIDLYDGFPHSNVFYRNDYKEIYRFGVSFSEEFKRDIRIFLLPITGQYNVFVGVNYIPKANNYTWNLPENSNSFLISNKDSKYKREGIYYILVEKMYNNDVSPHAYAVKFVTGQYATTLFEGLPEIGSLVKDDIAYYKFFISNMTNDITVSVMPLSGDPNLYISINSSNQLPSTKNYDFVSSLIGADSITIPAKTIKEKNKHCAEGYYVGANCGVYIAVVCATEMCTYSLQLGGGTKVAQRVIEGVPQFGIAEAELPAYFVFTPNATSEGTVISIQPIRGTVKGYLLIVPWNQNVYRQKGEMPGPNKKDKVSISIANSEMFIIDKEDKKKCGDMCDFYIGVYPDSGVDYSEFNIMAASGYAWLTDGRAVTDYVETNGYRYYKYNVACSKCTLTISLVPLSTGDPDLYVNKGSKLPTKEKADFKSASYRDDVLEIDWEDSFFKESTIKGEYTIGVYGYENCTYTITASSSSTNLKELSFGVPTRVQQYAGEITYYAFSSWKSSSIKISLIMMYGHAVIRANVFQDYSADNINEFLPSKEGNSVWSSLRSGTNNYLVIPKDDPKYTTTGTYLVGIEAKEDTNFDIMVEYVNDTEVSYIDMERPRRFTLLAGETINLIFLINSYENITCGLYINYGAVTGSISSTPSGTALWELKPNSDLIISTDDRNFALGRFYITIKAKVNADFVVQLREIASFAWLSEGIPQSGITGSNQMIYYKYKLNKVSHKNEYAVNINVKFSQKVTEATLFIKYAVDDTRPDKQYVDHTLVYDPYLDVLSGGVMVDAKKTDVISMGLTVVSSAPVQYTINAWSSGIVLLTPDIQYINGFKNHTEVQTYELVLDRNSKIALEITLCTGKVNAMVTKNLFSSTNLITVEEKKSTLRGSFDAAYGSYYITIGATELGKVTNDAWYIIKAKSQEDVEIYELENEGKITYELDGNEIKVRWGRLMRKGKGEVNDVKYLVFLSEEGKMNMDTPCGMILGKAEKVLETNHKTKGSVKLKGEYMGKNLIINVIAIPLDPWSILAYDAVTIQESASSGFSIFKAIIFLVVVGIIGAVVYYWNKLKQANYSQPRLVPEPLPTQSELKDIRPVSQYEQLS